VQDELNREGHEEKPPPREKLSGPPAGESEADVRQRLSDQQDAPGERRDPHP
jgi:hypothetical protein